MAQSLHVSGRLVVTGHRANGLSTFTSDEVVAATNLAAGGVRAAFFWGRDAVAQFPDSGQREELHSSQPPPGGCRFATLTIPDGQNNAYHEFVVSALGPFADPEAAGFHATPTIDFILVTDGRFELELDDAERKVLAAGDIAVLNGVRHRWSNPGPGEATLVAAQIGAQMSPRRAPVSSR